MANAWYRYVSNGHGFSDGFFTRSGFNFKFLLTLLVSITLSGCGSDDSGTPRVDDSVEQIISAAGGAITWTAKDGATEATLTVPNGALNNDTTITIQSATSVPSGISFITGTVLEYSPDGLVFNIPAELVVSYDPAALGGLDESSLKIYRSSNGVITELPSTVDTNAHTITAMVPGFSVIGVGLDTLPPSTGASPAGGNYGTLEAPDVTLTCTDLDGSGCSATYYTLDGSEPTTSSSVYSNPIPVTTSTTLKFFSMDNAGNSGATVTEDYTIIQVYNVGGTVTGDTLTNWLWLDLNGVAEWSISQLGTFAFPNIHTSGYNYTVTVKITPPGMNCIVTNGTGTIVDANITDIIVNCTMASLTYTVGGSVSGLNGTLVLQNNASENETINADGAFTFNTAITDGQSYNVTVLTQPAGQTCSVSNGIGTVSGANITNLAVSCQDNNVTTYSVSGNVSGLSGTLVLQNNGADNKTININGSFTFDTPIANGQTYSVTVLTQPQGQVCTVANSSGTVSSSTVTNVLVSCADIGSSKTWSHPVDNLDGFVSLDGRSPEAMKIRVANNGDKVIAWIENFPSTDPYAYKRVFMQEYRNGQWSAQPTSADDAISPPETEEQKTWSGTDPDEVALEMDNNGNAIIVWEQAGDTRTCAVGAAFCHVMFMKEYRNGSWSANPLYAEFFSAHDETVQDIQISMSDGGDAMITWQGRTQNGENSHLYAREYRSGQWSTPHIIGTLGGVGVDISEHAAAMDSSGNAIVVWRSGTAIYMSEYRNSAWATPQDLNDDLTGSGRSPQVAMANNGDAVIQWMDGASSSYWVEFFERRNNQWAASTNTDLYLNGSALYAQLAMNASGDTVIAWSEKDTLNPFIHPIYLTPRDLSHTFIAHYRNGSWTVPEDESDHVAAQPSISADSQTLAAAVDDEGNAMVFMEAPDADFNTYTCGYATCRRLFQTEFFAASNSWTHDTDQIDYTVDGVSPEATVFSSSDASFDLSANGNGVLLWKGSTVLSPSPYVFGFYWYLSERK